VDRSDIYVGIFAQRYGSGITEAEYRRAKKKGIPLLIYFKDDSVLVKPPDREEDPERMAYLEALKQELKRSHAITFFSSPDDLAIKVVAGLHNIASKPKMISQEHELLLALDSRRRSFSYLYFVAVLTTMIGFLFWIFGLESWIVPLIIASLFGYGVPNFLEYARVKVDYGQLIVGWCQANSHRLLFLYLFLQLGALVFGYSLNWYQVLSGVRFPTHLEGISREFFWRLVVLVGATAILHLPTSKNLGIRSASKWVQDMAKAERKTLVFMFLLFVVFPACLVPADVMLLVATPRVSFTESREVIEEVIHVEQKSDLSPSLNAYTLNEAHIHFLCPQAIVVKEFYVPFQTNSSKGFSVVTSSIGTVRTTLDKDQKVIGLNVSVRPFPEFQSEIVIHYHSELDLSRVLVVSGWNKQESRWEETLVRDFQNGTRVYRRTLTLTNISKYQVVIDGPFWIYIPSDRFEIKLEKEYSDASSLYSQSRQTYYLPSTTISSDGYVRIIITYVQG